MANDQPVTRKERFLAGAAGEDITLDTPITREERFLAKAAGMDVKTDDPVTRSEKYLAKIAEGGGGGSVPEYTGSYTVTPTKQTQTLATKDKKATANITVNPIPSQYVVPTGTKAIAANGTGIDVAAYSSVDVNVSGGGGATYYADYLTPVSESYEGNIDASVFYNTNDGYPGGTLTDKNVCYAIMEIDTGDLVAMICHKVVQTSQKITVTFTGSPDSQGANGMSCEITYNLRNHTKVISHAYDYSTTEFTEHVLGLEIISISLP